MIFTDFTSTINFIFGGLKTDDTITSLVQIDLNYLKVYDTKKSFYIKPIYNEAGEIVLYDTVSQSEIEMRTL